MECCMTGGYFSGDTNQKCYGPYYRLDGKYYCWNHLIMCQHTGS